MRRLQQIAFAVVALACAVAGAEGVPPEHPQEATGDGLLFDARTEMASKKPTAEWPGIGRIWNIEKTSGITVNLVELTGTLPMHFHPDCEDWLFLIEGQAKLLVGGKEVVMKPGDFWISRRACATS